MRVPGVRLPGRTVPGVALLLVAICAVVAVPSHTQAVSVHHGAWPDGRPKFEYEYRNGLLDGVSREWFSSGALWREQHYVAGHEAGLQRMYWEDGRVRASYVMRNGRRFGLMGAKGCVTKTDRSASLSLPYYEDGTLTPHWATDARELESAHVVGDFSLTNQLGKNVTRRDVAGRVYVASFFYSTCRTLCPAVREQLARVRDTFARDSSVMILSHTVTPEQDDVAALAHFATTNGIDHSKWHLLTGSRAELERLARERYFVELADTTGNTQGRLQHTETLVLVDRDGHVRGVYEGSLPFEVSQLIKDIHTLLSS
jgi:protein SCO1/2